MTHPTQHNPTASRHDAGELSYTYRWPGYRPFTPEEAKQIGVPWKVSRRGGGGDDSIRYMAPEGAVLGFKGLISYRDLYEDYDCSNDGQPCGWKIVDTPPIPAAAGAGEAREDWELQLWDAARKCSDPLLESAIKSIRCEIERLESELHTWRTREQRAIEDLNRATTQLSDYEDRWRSKNEIITNLLKEKERSTKLAEMVRERINDDGSTKVTPYGNPHFAEIRKLADQ